MPRSRIRSRSKSAHYSTLGGIITPKQRALIFGKKLKPIKGSDLRVKTSSKYMGTNVTPGNRIDYEKRQAEGFKEQYIRDVELKRQKIKDQEDKSKEEIENEILEFNNSQISEHELDLLAKRFSKFQRVKENKQFKAWLEGKDSFMYHGQKYPVITERFLKNSQSIKDIEKE